MQVHGFTDPAAFSRSVRPVLEREPDFTSVLATTLDHALHEPSPTSRWFLLGDLANPAAAAMHTPGFGLFVTPVADPVTAPTAMEALARVLRLTPEETLNGVTGPVLEARAFVRAWTGLTGVRVVREMPERLYTITEPPPPPDLEGRARRVSEPDVALAATWLGEFHHEAVPEQASADAEYLVRRRLHRGSLWFWETDAGPVSMAGVSRPVSAVARVGIVYTPKSLRGKGFGSAVTVAATRQGFLDGAQRCALYTDLSNPISNRIYVAIGYRPVGDAALVTFGEPPESTDRPRNRPESAIDIS